MLDAGRACAAYQDAHVPGLTSKRIQCDEIWRFVAAKQKNVPNMKAPVKALAMPGPGRLSTRTPR